MTKDHDFARHGFIIINNVEGERRHEENDRRIRDKKKMLSAKYADTLSLFLSISINKKQQHIERHKH